MLEFYHLKGGFLWWIIIRFCSTNLSDEQLETYKKKSDIFLFNPNFNHSLSPILFYILSRIL